MIALLALLAVLAVAAGASGVLLLFYSADPDWQELGKWLWTLAIALLVTGAISVLVKQIEARRSQKATFASLLHDLIAANRQVIVASRLMRAHMSAKTYRDQSAELIRIRADLRRVMASAESEKVRGLEHHLRTMCNFLDKLGDEYERNYLEVSRRQSVDEERIKVLVANTIATQPAFPSKSTITALIAPLSAWRILSDANQFPELAQLLASDFESEHPFGHNYQSARAILDERMQRKWR